MQIQKANLRMNGTPSINNHPNKIIIHHPVYNGSVVALNELMISMGYCMIGYNYYVRKDGSVWEGRPVKYEGGNCLGQNRQSIGVCCEGDFDHETMGAKQLNALVELCQYLKKQYGISEVGPHMKYSSTDCPGKYFPINEALARIAGGTYNGNVTIAKPSSEDTELAKAASYVGERCTELQTKLTALGYDCGGIDGIFGSKTFAAVKAFQKANGLAVDGYAGPDTFNALNKVVSCNHSIPSKDEIKTLQRILNTTWKLGLQEDGIVGQLTVKALSNVMVSRSDNYSELTKWIQNRLLHLGYCVGTCGADGYFGEGTEGTIKKFQKDHGISADGIVGSQTMLKLLHTTVTNNSVTNVVGTLQNALIQSGFSLPKYGADGAYGSETRSVLQQIIISKGSKYTILVKWIQNRLKNLGYDIGSYGADGAFGNSTLSAVKKFQTKRGLSSDGIVGINTWEALLKA